MKEKNSRGSFTVEAAFIVSISLFAIGTMIVTAFSLHDKALSRAVLIEAVELKSHEAEDADSESWYLSEEKLRNVLSGEVPVLSLTEDGGTVTGKDFSYQEKSGHIRAEKLLRTLTLLEIFEGEEP